MSFLDDMFSTIGDVGKSALGALSSAAPALGTLIGGRFGGPQGAAIGSALGGAAQNFMGGGRQQPQAPQQGLTPENTANNPMVSPETWSLAPTPSPNMATQPYPGSGGMQNEASNPFYSMQPGNVGGWAGRQAGQAVGNAARNAMSPYAQSNYGNRNFGEWGGQAGQDFASMISNMLPQQFQGMAQPFLQNAGRSAGNWLTQKFMPQDWQNRNLNSFGDMGEQYGSQYNDQINNAVSPGMQRGIKNAAFPQLAAERAATAGQGNLSDSSMNDFSDFSGSIPGFKYGGHVTRGNRDFASVMGDLGYAY